MTSKVLIVDDSELIRNAIREMLERLPCVTDIQEAGDVPDAVTVLTQWQPDLVTLDLHLPGGSGLDVLRAIRTSGHSPTIIVVSSLSDPQTRDACLAAGADVVLDKAFEMDWLPRIVSLKLRPNLVAQTSNRRPPFDGTIRPPRISQCDMNTEGHAHDHRNSRQRSNRDMKNVPAGKILVADDDVGIRGLLRIVLEQRGYEVLTAGNGLATLESFIRHRPSTVILDLHMPGMKGFDVLAELRACYPDVRIIVHSGWDIESIRLRALSLGASEVFQKGRSLTELADFIQNPGG